MGKGGDGLLKIIKLSNNIILNCFLESGLMKEDFELFIYILVYK